MNYNDTFKIVQDLEVGEEITFFEENKTAIKFLLRPTKVYKNYDIKKNIQIFLKEENRVFRPNHLRIIIDLHLRVRVARFKKRTSDGI